MSVALEPLAEVLDQQTIFDSTADFDAGDEQDEGKDQYRPGRDQETGADQEAQHRQVNRMADDAIGAPRHELVVFVETRVEPPLSSECARRRPRQRTGADEEADGRRNSPRVERSVPKPVLPQ